MIPAVSIIVPIYNAEDYLRRCVESICNQTLSNIQIILVDDGSEDESGKICDEYSQKDKRIIAVHSMNRGVSAARNTGLEIATGEYIGFVDADDYIESDMYSKMYQSAKEYNADICCCGYIAEGSDSAYIKSIDECAVFDSEKEIFRAYFRQDKYEVIGNGNWNKIFSRNIVGESQYSLLSHGEDIEFQCNLFMKASKMICIPTVLYHYVSNNASASHKKYNDGMYSLCTIADRVVDQITERYPDIKYQAEAFRLTWYMVIIQIIYNGRTQKANKKALDEIRNSILKKLNVFGGNKYAKRLDKYLMYALIFKCVPVAIKFRNLVVAWKSGLR